MTDITPADLARFVHPVPVGATIPAGMKFCYQKASGAITGPLTRTLAGADVSVAEQTPYWTAEPIPAPKPPLTERAREFANEVLAAPPVGFSSVILDTENQQNRWIAEAASILAEIAERLDAGR